MKSNITIAMLFIFFLIGTLVAFDICDSEDFASKTIIVPDHYEKIQSAIDAAKEFDTIIVRNGLYKEHIQISYKNSLKILAEGNSVIVQWNGGRHIVEVYRSFNITFAGFIVDGSANTNWAGIYLWFSTNITIANNTVINGYRGVYLWDTHHCFFRNNHLSENTYNLEVWGLTLPHFLHDIDESNIIDGKPVYYWVNQTNRQIPSGAGYVGIVNSSNITVKDFSLTKNAHGVLLAHSNNCLVENVSLSHNIRGIQMVVSDSSTLVGNNISDCEESGITLTIARDNKIINNVIEKNEKGIWLSFSPDLIKLRSTHNIVNGNYIEDNHFGIYLSESHNNTISHNVISENEYGFFNSNSNNNSIYHNNFLNNTFQVAALGSNSFNTWDNSYPSGGNQWSDYSGVDVKRGLYQNESGSDGIGDTPYLIHGSALDRYPLVPPKIDFSFQPSSPKVSDEITFSGILLAPYANISSWKWKMSDGSALFGQNVTHKFVEEGSYNVSLVVTDSRGAIGVIEKSVNIVGSTSEDASTLIVGVIIGVILSLSIVIGYFVWKLRKR